MGSEVAAAAVGYIARVGAARSLLASAGHSPAARLHTHAHTHTPPAPALSNPGSCTTDADCCPDSTCLRPRGGTATLCILAGDGRGRTVAEGCGAGDAAGAKAPAAGPEGCICTREFMPVCFDSASYSNRCVLGCNATATAELESGAGSVAQGECGDGRMTADPAPATRVASSTTEEPHSGAVADCMITGCGEDEYCAVCAPPRPAVAGAPPPAGPTTSCQPKIAAGGSCSAGYTHSGPRCTGQLCAEGLLCLDRADPRGQLPDAPRVCCAPVPAPSCRPGSVAEVDVTGCLTGGCAPDPDAAAPDCSRDSSVCAPDEYCHVCSPSGAARAPASAAPAPECRPAVPRGGACGEGYGVPRAHWDGFSF